MIAQTTDRHVERTSSRSGSFVVEALVAMLLLGTASLAVVRLARSSVELRHRGDREVAAILTAENVLIRLAPFSAEELAGQVEQVQQASEAQSGCNVEVTLRSFEREELAGVHIVVDVSVDPRVRVTLHDWRLRTKSPSDSASAEGANASSESDADAAGRSDDGSAGNE